MPTYLLQNYFSFSTKLFTAVRLDVGPQTNSDKLRTYFPVIKAPQVD